MEAPGSEACSWCGAVVEPSEGYRAYESAGDRRALFCRLEHVVPWMMQGPQWEAGAVSEPGLVEQAGDSCALCGGELKEVHVLLVHHRGEHRVSDPFCSAEHMADWAKAGGRWQ